MEQNNISAEQAVEGIYKYAADLMVRQDKNSYEVKQALIAKGLSEENAGIVVENLEEQISKARSSRAGKDMLFGGLWCVGGIVVTVATYSAASGGGRYVVAYGAIIFGAIQFIRGLVNISK